MAALYMTKRRLTTDAAAMVTTSGDFAAMSCATMSCAMPENENIDSAMPSTALMPAAIAATPATKPNGMVPISMGAMSRAPERNSERGVTEGADSIERRLINSNA